MLDQRVPDLNAAVERSHGGIATIWEYNSSLSELSIRISWVGTSENIHLICNGCLRIEATTGWSDVNLEYKCSETDEFRLIDKQAQFLVLCKSIRVFMNVEPRFLTQ